MNRPLGLPGLREPGEPHICQCWQCHPERYPPLDALFQLKYGEEITPPYLAAYHPGHRPSPGWSYTHFNLQPGERGQEFDMYLDGEYIPFELRQQQVIEAWTDHVGWLVYVDHGVPHRLSAYQMSPGGPVYGWPACYCGSGAVCALVAYGRVAAMPKGFHKRWGDDEEALEALPEVEQ